MNNTLHEEIIHSKSMSTELYNKIIDFTTFLDEGVPLKARIWAIAQGLTSHPKCRTCGSNTKWSNFAKRYTFHCCCRCRAIDPEVKAKQDATSIERYGELKLLSNKTHIEKTRETSIKNNGVAYPLQNKKIKERTTESKIVNYGEDYAKIIYEQSFKPILKEKYNTDTFGHIKKTPGVLEKSCSTYRKRHIATRLKLLESVSPLFAPEDYINHDQLLSFKCNKCNAVFSDFLKDGKQPRCLVCFPLNSVNWNQQELVDFCKTLNSNAEHNIRSVISPQELDVVFKDNKLAIEYNGLYWHSEEGSGGRIDEKYHLSKTQRCNSIGYDLLHIFEDDWINKQPIVKSIIKHKLGITEKKIYARKCHIAELSATMSNEFLDSNHIQGADKTPIRLGLFYNNELVSVMTYSKPRFNKDADYELVRFASKLDTIVVGGFSKLLRYFIKQYNPQTIITYADRTYSSGNVYKNNGFTTLKVNPPSYSYVNMKDCSIRHNRMKFQKHKLKKVLTTYDPKLTEYENMKKNRFSRIWDCGSITFFMDLTTQSKT